MNEEPLQTIEDYLALVRSHLPLSAVQDVIDELRDYIVDAATELGNGAVTLKSAKRAVARMGAPSEVAREYIASLVAEAEPQEVSDTAVEGLETPGEKEALSEVGGGLTPVPEATRKTTRLEPTTYKSAILRVLVVLGLLSLVVSLSFAGAALILLEMATVMAVLGPRLGQLYRRRDTLMRISYNDPVRGFLSIPRKLDPFVSRRMVLLDLWFTVGLTTVLLGGLGFIVGGLEQLSAAISWSLLLARGAVVMLRIERPIHRPLFAVRIQWFLQIAAAVLLNITAEVSIFLYYWFDYGYSLAPFLSPAAVVFATYMLLLSTTQIDYVWGVPESGVFPRAAAPLQSTVLKKRPEHSAAVDTKPGLRLLSIFSSWFFWMFVFLALLPAGLVAFSGTVPWTPESTAAIWTILGYTCLLVFLVIWPVVIYLGVRWAFLRRGRSEVLVGFRSRPEAVIDFIATALLTIFLLYTFLSYPFQFYMRNLAEESATIFRYRLLVVVCSLAVSGLIARVASDMVNAVNRDSAGASSTLRLSCFLCLTAIGGSLGEAVLANPYGSFLTYMMASSWFAFPAALLGLQAVTSKTKFRRLQQPKRTAPLPSRTPLDSSMDVPPGIAAFHVLRTNTVLLALFWPVVSFFMTLFLLNALGFVYYPAWEAIILVGIVYAGSMAALTMVYFGVRRAMIYAGEASTVIGGRGRAEAAVDLAGIAFAFAALGFYSNQFYFTLAGSPVTIDRGLALFFHIIFWEVFFVGALLRGAADVASIGSRRKVIPRAVFLVSGVVLLGGMALIIPLHIAIVDPSWAFFWSAVAALLNLQVVTSFAALNELSVRRTQTVVGEPPPTGYPPGMTLPTN